MILGQVKLGCACPRTRPSGPKEEFGVSWVL
jgi:hypothetical protein